MLSGNDSLLSIVQMPKGVPVATVAIHNAANAGLLAARTIGAGNRVILDKMQVAQRKSAMRQPNALYASHSLDDIHTEFQQTGIRECLATSPSQRQTNGGLINSPE